MQHVVWTSEHDPKRVLDNRSIHPLHVHVPDVTVKSSVSDPDVPITVASAFSSSSPSPSAVLPSAGSVVARKSVSASHGSVDPPSFKKQPSHRMPYEYELALSGDVYEFIATHCDDTYLKKVRLLSPVLSIVCTKAHTDNKQTKND